MPRVPAATTKIRPQSVVPNRSARAASSRKPDQHRYQVHGDEQQAADGVGLRLERGAGEVVDQPVRAGDERGIQRRLAGIQMAVVLDHVDGVPAGLADHLVDGIGAPPARGFPARPGPARCPSGCGRWRFRTAGGVGRRGEDCFRCGRVRSSILRPNGPLFSRCRWRSSSPATRLRRSF